MDQYRCYVYCTVFSAYILQEQEFLPADSVLYPEWTVELWTSVYSNAIVLSLVSPKDI